MEHRSLRPHMADDRDLYDKLQSDQIADARALDIKYILFSLLFFAAFLWQPKSHVATIIFAFASAMTGFSIIHSIVDRIHRNWFMHWLTLKDLPPREPHS